MGYAGDHEEENKTFVNLSDDTRMYHSRDLGYILPDGNIAFLHRMDTQIMIYGKRVEVMEVESKLYQVNGVEQAVVRPFTEKEGLPCMIVCIVPKKKGLKVSQVKRDLSENLTPFMILEFIVKMPHIPLNSNDKPDNGEIIGCGGNCYQREMPSPDNLTGTNGYIMNNYTLPKYRGYGVGRKIIDFFDL